MYNVAIIININFKNIENIKSMPINVYYLCQEVQAIQILFAWRWCFVIILWPWQQWLLIHSIKSCWKPTAKCRSECHPNSEKIHSWATSIQCDEGCIRGKQECCVSMRKEDLMCGEDKAFLKRECHLQSWHLCLCAFVNSGGHYDWIPSL